MRALNPRAERALEGASRGRDEIPIGDLWSSVRRATSVGQRLLDHAAIAVGEGLEDLTVNRQALLEAAASEAERLGSVLVGGEHLVLGAARALSGHGGERAGLDLGRLRSALSEVSAAGAFENLLASSRDSDARGGGVVLVCGLPGTGKSTVADELARLLGAAVLSLDWLLGALTPFGLVRMDNAAAVGEHLLLTETAKQLRSGRWAVVDMPGHTQRVRDRFAAIAAAFEAAYVGIECTCSNVEDHRSRVQARDRRIPGWHATVSWDHVESMRRSWEHWSDPNIVLDTCGPVDLDVIVDEVRRLSDARRN